MILSSFHQHLISQNPSYTENRLSGIEQSFDDPDQAYSKFMEALKLADDDSTKVLLAELAFSFGAGYYNLLKYRGSEKFFIKSSELFLSKVIYSFNIK